MHLYIVRHGEALTKEQDPLRPLSDQGREDVARIGAFMRYGDVSINQVFHSTKVRAIQTAEIIAKELAFVGKIESLSCLEPESDIKALMYAINKLPDNTLIVGHLPNLELLSNYLLTGFYNKSTLTIYPATAACFKLDGAAWNVRWLIDPQLLNKILL